MPPITAKTRVRSATGMGIKDVVPAAADPGGAALVGAAVGPGVPAIVTVRSTTERNCVVVVVAVLLCHTNFTHSKRTALSMSQL